MGSQLAHENRRSSCLCQESWMWQYQVLSEANVEKFLVDLRPRCIDLPLVAGFRGFARSTLPCGFLLYDANMWITCFGRRHETMKNGWSTLLGTYAAYWAQYCAVDDPMPRPWFVVVYIAGFISVILILRLLVCNTHPLARPPADFGRRTGWDWITVRCTWIPWTTRSKLSHQRLVFIR